MQGKEGCAFAKQCQVVSTPRLTNLPGPAVDAIHRIVTDASRLTETWLAALYTKGMSDGGYIELLGIVVAVISIDGFHRALGMPPEPLPEPVAGEPSGLTPRRVGRTGCLG